MALKEIPLREGEQMIFPGIELAEIVREIAAIEFAKKKANEEWTDQLKALKKRMFKLAESMAQVDKEKS